MNASRAQEILQSDERIEVKLNGVPVWIDNVDGARKTAKVHAEDNPADVKVVPVEELQEAH
jgi:small acid-soluble spore protein H (minor)